MKAKRNLSGIYLRAFNDDDEKWESRVFEDLDEKQQDECMRERDIEWHKRMIKLLADTLNEIGEQFDVIKD